LELLWSLEFGAWCLFMGASLELDVWCLLFFHGDVEIEEFLRGVK